MGDHINFSHRKLHSLKYVPVILEPISYPSRKQERVSNRIILLPFSFPKSLKKVYITIPYFTVHNPYPRGNKTHEKSEKIMGRHVDRSRKSFFGFNRRLGLLAT